MFFCMNGVQETQCSVNIIVGEDGCDVGVGGKEGGVARAALPGIKVSSGAQASTSKSICRLRFTYLACYDYLDGQRC